MAGYIAAVQSEEYRIGIISVNDAAGQDYRDAFLNGVIYFCGNCATIYPPFEVYPVYEEVAPGADQTALENAAQTLIGRGVNMMLVAPGLQDAGFYQYLAQNGVRMIGTDAPPAGLEGYLGGFSDAYFRSQPGSDFGGFLGWNRMFLDPGHWWRSITPGLEKRGWHISMQILEKLNSGAIDPLGKVD